MKNILVTGAAGFIGSFLCEELVKKGNKVIGIDNLFRGKIENLSSLTSDKNFIFRNIDLSKLQSKEKLKAIYRDSSIDLVYHLAAINGTQHFYDNSTFVLEQNIKITMNLMESLENSCVKKIIYTSSSEVYGEPINIPTSEEEPIRLNSYADRDSYASSKALGDFYVRLYAQEYNMEYIVLRVFNMYGERMVNTKYGQVIPEFIQRMLYENEFTVIGDGSHMRSFCYIKDAVILMEQLIDKDFIGFLNLGNDEEISINNLAKKLHDLEGLSFNPIYLKERPNDHKRRKPDIKKLYSLFPDLKFTPMDVALEKVIEYYKNLN